MWKEARSRASFGPITPVNRSTVVLKSLACNLLQFNRDCDVEQPTFAFLGVLCPMGEQAASEYSSKAHERVALARGAFVTSTATDDLAIQEEGRIPERENSCVQMVRSNGEHIYQPGSLRYGPLHSTGIPRDSQCVTVKVFSA